MTGRSRYTPRAADVALLALTLLGLALRAYSLKHRGMWWDEACVWGEAFMKNAAYQEAPLNSWLARLVMEVLRRDDTLALHVPALLCGTLQIPAAYRLGSGLGGRVTGLVLALLVTLSPSLIFYSQEARPYSLLILLTTLQLGSAVRLVDHWSGRELAWLALSTSAAILAHLVALPFSLALGLALTVPLALRLQKVEERAQTWRRLAVLLLVGGAAIGLGASWTLFRPSFTPVLSGRYLYGPVAFLRSVLQFATTCPPGIPPHPRAWTLRDLVAAIYVACAVAGALVLASRRRGPTVLVLVLPPVVLLIGLYFQLGTKSTWPWSRYATPATIPLFALAAIALTTPRRPLLAALATLAFLAPSAHPRIGLPAWARDARLARGSEYADGANEVLVMSERLRGVVFIMQRSIYADETSRAIISYEQYRRDELPQFYTRDGQVFAVRLQPGPGHVPIPVLEDKPVTLAPGDYAMFVGWDKRGCPAYVPGLVDAPFPAVSGAIRLCRVP